MTTVRDLPREARRLSWVLLAVAASMLPHATSVPIGLVVLVIAAGVWRLFVALRDWPMPGRTIRTLIALLATLGVLAVYRTFNGLEAGTALLMAMAGVKLLETRSVRDLTVLLLLAYFLLFAAFLYNQSLVQLPYMILAAWLLTATLLRIHEAEATLPVREALATTGKMLLQAAPIAALLFVFFPRLPGHFWALPPRDKAQTGLSEEMTPGDVSELTISGAIAFRAHFDGPVPPPSDRYWRGPVLHEFDGRTWRRSRGMFLSPQSVVASGVTYRYRVTIEPHQRRWVFALDSVTDWPAERAFRTSDLQLLAKEPISSVTSFTLQSQTKFRVPEPLPLTMRRLDTAQNLERNPRSRALALQLRERAGSEQDYIDLLLQKFRREDFVYTLQPPTLSSDSVDDFLFNTKKGFCEHFASAFTMMVRAAGIPARVVTGYQGGEYNRVGDFFVIRQSDAHAWSEVWLAGRGWVRIDPTAAVAPQRIERGLEYAISEDEPVPGRFLRRSELLTRLRDTWDAVNTFWHDSIVEYDADRQRSLLRTLGLNPSDWRTIGLTLVFAVMTVLALLAGWLAWTYGHRRTDPAARVYARLCKRLAKRAAGREPREGPRDYLERVATTCPDLAPRVRIFASLYLAHRYGPAPNAASLQKLRDAAGAIRL